jgi:hypothetical protein
MKKPIMFPRIDVIIEGVRELLIEGRKITEGGLPCLLNGT